MKKKIALLCASAGMLAHAQSHKLFKQEYKPLKGEPLVMDTQALTLVADDTAHFLEKVPASKYTQVDNGVFDHHAITLVDVQETAAFIARVGKQRPELLKSPWFYNEYFDFYRWYADPQALVKMPPMPRGWGAPPEYIRTTKYRSCKVYGSHTKTKKYTYPLYAVPTDEKNKTPSQVRAEQNSLARFKYTRSQILAGALEKTGLTTALAWVDEQEYKEFVMQGSVKVAFDDGKEQVLRVAGNNSKDRIDSYWFASPVVYKDPRRSKFPLKVEPQPGVSFAGNTKDLGFGKVIALRGWNTQTEQLETRIGLLVDTGTAFTDNLYQLDIFTGYFDSKAEYHKNTIGYPHTAQAYILIRNKKKFRL